MKIHKEVYGQGKVIVLIHGWGMHTGIWRKFAQQLALNNKVICVDLPGHGLSEMVEPYTLENISKVLINDISEHSFCVLGWSFGASVAVTMAVQNPSRITSLILLAGNPKFVESDDWAGVRLELLEEFAENLQLNCAVTLVRFLALQVNSLAEGKALLNDLKKAVQECDPPTENVLQRGLKILKNEDLRDKIVSLTCPLTIIQGDADTLVPVQVGQNIQSIKPSCEVNIIAGAGHVPFLSHQQQVIEIIDHCQTEIK